MVERDKMCWTKRQIKRKGKILSENRVKKGTNEGQIEGYNEVCR